MGLTNFPNGITSFGIPVLGSAGGHVTTGNVFFVSSTASGSSDGNTGDSPTDALATLDAAIGKTTANQGDTIYVMPNHAETVTGASGITFDVAGVTVIGLGEYKQRPRFLMDGATTVTAVISAADVSLQNLEFAAGHADIVTCFGVTSTGAWFDKIMFTDNTAAENWLTCVKATGTTNNEADGLKVTNCEWSSIDTAGVEMLEVNADIAEMVFSANWICHDAAVGVQGILLATGKDIQRGRVVGNMLISGGTATVDMLILTDTTANSGIVAFNLIGHHDTAGEVLVDADGMRQFENRGTATDTASGYVLPAIDS